MHSNQFYDKNIRERHTRKRFLEDHIGDSARMLWAGLYKLLHPAIPDWRTCSELGGHGEREEHGEHGEQGKDAKH